jgi:hypothetical protein
MSPQLLKGSKPLSVPPVAYDPSHISNGFLPQTLIEYSKPAQFDQPSQPKPKRRRQLISPVSLLNDYAVHFKEKSLFADLKGDKTLFRKHHHTQRLKAVAKQTTDESTYGEPLRDISGYLLQHSPLRPKHDGDETQTDFD